MISSCSHVKRKPNLEVGGWLYVNIWDSDVRLFSLCQTSQSDDDDGEVTMVDDFVIEVHGEVNRSTYWYLTSKASPIFPAKQKPSEAKFPVSFARSTSYSIVMVTSIVWGCLDRTYDIYGGRPWSALIHIWDRKWLQFAQSVVKISSLQLVWNSVPDVVLIIFFNETKQAGRWYLHIYNTLINWVKNQSYVHYHRSCYRFEIDDMSLTTFHDSSWSIQPKPNSSHSSHQLYSTRPLPSWVIWSSTITKSGKILCVTSENNSTTYWILQVEILKSW